MVNGKQLSPELIAEWHPTLNGQLLPSEVAAKSNKKVWWLCAQGHEWQAVVASRSNGRGCRACAGQTLISGENDLLTRYPKIAAEWHPELNGDLSPNQVMPGTHLSVWWVCASGHDYQAPVSKRTSRGQGCKYCSGKGLGVGINDLESTHPELAKEWHPTLNGSLLPTDIQPGSNRKVFWICSNGHPYKSSPANRTAKKATGCAVCSGQQVMKGVNDLETTNPALASQWHSTLNGSLMPSEVTESTSKKIVWQCALNEDHYWTATGYSRKAGQGCSVCRGLTVIEGVNDLRTLAPDLASEWDISRNLFGPEKVTPGSSKQVGWICNAGHTWTATVKSRVSGNGCKYCSGRNPVIGQTDLPTTHPNLMLEWDYEANKRLDPTTLIAGTNKKISWICSLGHKWKATGNHRVRGQGCPFCSTGGFMISRPGILYFIMNENLGASKIGITNVESKTDRLGAFQRLGWEIIYTLTDEDGELINMLESCVLRWIRRDLNLPPYLAKEDMGKIAGWSETFSSDAIPNQDVISRIQREFERLRART